MITKKLEMPDFIPYIGELRNKKRTCSKTELSN